LSPHGEDISERKSFFASRLLFSSNKQVD
jgi:hypothetical protein